MDYFTFGKYYNHLAMEVILMDAGYMGWILSETQPIGALANMKSTARVLCTRVDAKPFTCQCFRCEQRAEHCVADSGIRRLSFGCRECCTHWVETRPQTRFFVDSYRTLCVYCKRAGRMAGFESDVGLTYARAKGLHPYEALTPERAIEFFRGTEPRRPRIQHFQY